LLDFSGSNKRFTYANVRGEGASPLPIPLSHLPRLRSRRAAALRAASGAPLCRSFTTASNSPTGIDAGFAPFPSEVRNFTIPSSTRIVRRTISAGGTTPASTGLMPRSTASESTPITASKSSAGTFCAPEPFPKLVVKHTTISPSSPTLTPNVFLTVETALTTLSPSKTEWTSLDIVTSQIAGPSGYLDTTVAHPAVSFGAVPLTPIIYR
jgi:hypothetical protein